MKHNKTQQNTAKPIKYNANLEKKKKQKKIKQIKREENRKEGK